MLTEQDRVEIAGLVLAEWAELRANLPLPQGVIRERFGAFMRLRIIPRWGLDGVTEAKGVVERCASTG